MKKYFISIFILLISYGLFSQNNYSSYVKNADTVNRIIGIDKTTGKAKYGLKVGNDTAWMVWDGSVLNFIADTLKHNGSPIGADFTLTTTGTSGPSTYTGGVLNIPVYSSGSGGSSPWRDEWGMLFYPPGFNNITALFAPDDSIVGIERPYFGDIQRKSLTGYDVYNLLAIKLQPNNFRMVANKYYEINSSWFRGNVDSINAYLANFPEIKRLIVDTITTMNDDWNIPADMIIEFKNGGYITASSTFDLNADNTTIVAGDFKIVGSNVNLYNDWKAETIYPEWFGAVGDGTTNNYTALGKWIDFLSICDYQTAELSPNKNYYFYPQINKAVTGKIIIDGNGSELFSDDALYGALSPSILEFYQDPLFEKTAAANIAFGVDWITLNNTTSLTDEMVAYLLGDLQYYEGGGSSIQLHRATIVSPVTGINGTTVKLADVNPFSTLKSDSINARDGVDFYGRYQVEIRNIKISVTNQASNACSGLSLKHIYKPVVENVTFRGGYGNLKLNACYGAILNNLKYESDNDATATYAGHAVWLTGCVNTRITNSTLISRTSALQMSYPGLSWGTLVDNCVIKGYATQGQGIDSHGSFQTRVINSTIYGTNLNGNFVFDNCKLYPFLSGSNDVIFSERDAASYLGGFTFTVQNSKIYFPVGSGTVGYFVYRPYDPTASYTGNVYNFINNEIYLDRDARAVNTRTMSIGASVGNMTFSGNKFYGAGLFVIPRYKTAGNTVSTGKFIFTNNQYDNVSLIQPGVDQFGQFVFENNLPISSAAVFTISVSTVPINHIFKNNTITGAAVSFNGYSGSLEFTNNTITSSSTSTITGSATTSVGINKWAGALTISNNAFTIKESPTFSSNVTVNNLMYQGASGSEMITKSECKSVANGASINLPANINYTGKVWIKESGDFTYAEFKAYQDGSPSIFTERLKGVDTGYTSETLQISDGGTYAVITNNFGVSKTICYKIEY